jgi:hypothetical protein
MADELVLEERVTTPDAATVAWQELPAAVAENFTVVDAPPSSRPESAGRISRDRRLRLFPKHPGTIELPARQVKITGGAAEQQLELPALAVTVVSIVKNADPLPLPDPLTMRQKVKIPWQPLGLAGVLVVLVVVAAVWWWRRRLRPLVVPLPAPIPLLPPAEEALAALARLEAADLVGTGAFKEFYLGLTTILRRYLERRFEVAALERTTEEFLAETRGDPRFAGPECQPLAGLLAEADLVKFAEMRPAAAAAQSALAACRQLVEATRPRPEAIPPAEPPATVGGAA